MCGVDAGQVHSRLCTERWGAARLVKVSVPAWCPKNYIVATAGLQVRPSDTDPRLSDLVLYSMTWSAVASKTWLGAMGDEPAISGRRILDR